MPLEKRSKTWLPLPKRFWWRKCNDLGWYLCHKAFHHWGQLEWWEKSRWKTPFIHSLAPTLQYQYSSLQIMFLLDYLKNLWLSRWNNLLEILTSTRTLVRSAWACSSIQWAECWLTKLMSIIQFMKKNTNNSNVIAYSTFESSYNSKVFNQLVVSQSVW